MRKKYKIILISVLLITASSLSVTFGILFYINKPSARFGYGMVYDESINKVVLFGGTYQDSNSYTSYGDTWMYDPVTNIWTEISLQQHPAARSSHSLVYDPVNQKIILFGGVDINDNWRDDTWIFDSQTITWTQVFPETNPPVRGSASTYYDPHSKRIILFGGYRQSGAHLDDTWAYNYSDNSWINLDPSLKPTGRYGATMVYDPINQRGFMFGGRISIISDESWVYYSSNNSWIELNLTVKPRYRYWEGLTYDKNAQRIILFGGSSGNVEALGDTWIYNPFTNQWTRVFPESSPINRLFLSFVYVSEIRKAIIFGGSRFADTCLDDTWSYDYNVNYWNKLK